MTDITHIFGGPLDAASAQQVEPVEIQVLDAMKASGIEELPKQIKIDGQLHRFHSGGKKKNNNGYYVVYADGVPAGVFGCWRLQVQSNFVAKVGRELTAEERMAHTMRLQEAKQIRDAERERRQGTAEDVISTIWENAGGASPDHPYLKRKGVQPHGVRITGDGRLIAPLYGEDGELRSLQYISPDGDKKYHPGASTKDAWWMLGDVSRTIFIAEGFATAATIHEETGEACAVAYSASGLVPVARQIRDRYGALQEIVVVADNDENGIGRKYADQCAAKYGCRVVLPPTLGGDANDYKQEGGDLQSILFPPSSEWLIQADDFSLKPAPLKWLIKNWLQDHALIMVHGPSGGGKTFVVLDWMLHISSAISEWMGHKVTPGSVVYLAGEGHYGLRGRIAAWKQHHGVDQVNMYISKAGCDLNTAEGYQKVREALIALSNPPSIIVVDTLHRFLDGDENSSQDAKTMLDACAALIEQFSCTVLLVHHTGISDEAQHRARGSSAWRGALDVEISIVPPKRGGSISIIQRKSKDTELQPAEFADLHAVSINGWLDEDGETVSSAVIKKGMAPVETKKNKKLDDAKRRFEAIWDSSGREVDQRGRPYVTRSSIATFIENVEGKAKETARKYANKDYQSGVIAPLGPLIDDSANGYAIVDQDWQNEILILQKNARPN